MKISIVTITYNAEKFLEKTMLSILSQSNHNFEYWLIDGGSKDQTVSLIEKMSERIASGEFPGVDSSQFKWISEPDNGLYDAMNKGLERATGSFVWFINAGDQIYDSETFQKVENLLEIEPECDFIYGQSIMINEQDQIIGEMIKRAPRILTKNSFLNGLVICHQSVILRRDIVTKYNLKYTIASDYDWVIRAFEKSKCQGYIDQYLSKYLAAGISIQKKEIAWKERYIIMKEHFGIIKTIWAHLRIILHYPFSKKY